MTEDRPARASIEEGLDELAEDMLHVLERLSSLEQKQIALQARVEDVLRVLADTGQAQGRATDALRRELVGERKALAARSALDAVASALDSVRRMRGGLDPEVEERLHAQLGAVASALGSAVQNLGFTELAPAAGDAFDPARMECLAYGEGEPGRVLELLQPGYVAQDVVVRPAGVRLARAAGAGGEGGTR